MDLVSFYMKNGWLLISARVAFDKVYMLVHGHDII